MAADLPRRDLPVLPILRQNSPAPLSRSAASSLQHLSRLIAKVTIDDINSAERCGGGGFGDVYVLTHPTIGKLALKRVRTSGNQHQIDAQIRRSAREAETWRKLTHPNVLPFLDVIERSGGIYLVSPFVENGSLRDYTRNHPDADRARLIQEAAAGIAYLHRCGVIHGDIKGANILVSDNIRALLCDFGLAREQQAKTSTAMQGVGTLRWKNPELLESEGGKSFKSDVWAFAMTIYEILSGRVPYYHHGSQSAVIIAVVLHKQRPPREPATSPSGASYAPLWDVAGNCWHEDPDQRPEMQEAYDQLILGGFRSLLLSPPGDDDEDTRKDLPIISPPLISPPPHPFDTPRTTLSPIEAAADNEAHIDVDQVERRPPSEEASTATLSDETRSVHSQRDLAQNCENAMVPSVKLRRQPRDCTLRTFPFGVKSVVFSPDGNYIAIACDLAIRFWDVEARSQRGKRLKGHTGTVYCLAFSPDGTTLASGSNNHSLRLWDTEVSSQRGKPLEGHTGRVHCLAFSPDGTTIASGSWDKTVRFWDVDTRNQGHRLLDVFTHEIRCLAFSPNGSTIAIGTFDSLYLYDVETRSRQGKPLVYQNDIILCLAYSPDGTTIASGSICGDISLWDVEARSPRGEPLRGHTSGIKCIAYSPDGTTIASGSADNFVRLWDVETGRQRGEPLEGHINDVDSLSFSPDGQAVVSGSRDGAVRIWRAVRSSILGGS